MRRARMIVVAGLVSACTPPAAGPVAQPAIPETSSTRLDAALPRDAESPHPAVLFASPSGTGSGRIDLRYLSELHAKGFEVDYTEGLDELNWDRVRKYNVLVITISPDAWDVLAQGLPSSAAKIETFTGLVNRFVDEGGGVLLFPAESNWAKWSKQALSELTETWGAKLPLELIVENDPNRVGVMTHSSYSTRLAYTDRILPSPVTSGVRGFWFPIESSLFGGMTGPIVVESEWKVVARASSSAVTAPFDTSKMATKPHQALIRSNGEREPALVAIRDLRAGRVALVHQWPQFTFGAGTKWFYNREVLERGLRGKPSDFGRLLENMFRWLAEPSLGRHSLGTFVTPAERLRAPNEREEVRRLYRDPSRPYPANLDEVQQPSLKTYKGLIGAETSYGSGSGTVEEYARAAREAKLDFVVFLDAFNRLTPERLESLKADCAKLSGPELLLLPGFTIDSNLGDHFFFFSPNPAWPPDGVLTGSRGKRTLYLQEEDGRGGFTGYLTPYPSWILDAYHVEKGQVGLYDLVDSPRGMRLHDARLYAMVGLHFYRNGRLAENLRDAYLTTVQSTIAPSPVVVDRVKSPAALVQAVRARHSLTYTQARSLDASARDGIFLGALRWSHQYESLPVYVSSGPTIVSWPACYRAHTYGAEGFVPSRSFMPSPLSVYADRGLSRVTIYDGRRIFRRFKLHGEKSFQKTLALDGSIQRNLVLIAEDRGGGIAVSAPLRSWAEGALAPSFCSDHVNDCRHHMLLAHGPYTVPLDDAPQLPIDVAGGTWDGGPPAAMPLVRDPQTAPRLDSNRGSVDAARADQIPLLDFSDEGAVSITSERGELYHPKLARVVNPWNTFGPLGGGPIPLFDHVNRFREWVTPTLGAPESEWAGGAVRTGIAPTLFSDTLRFKRNLAVKALCLASFSRNPKGSVVVGSSEVHAYGLGSGAPAALHVDRGDWFGFFGDGFNAQLYVNRGEPIRIAVDAGIEFHADPPDPSVRAGQTYVFEVAGFGFPLDVPITSQEGFAPYVQYLRHPTGLIIDRGTRIESPGLLEVMADAGAVELSVPRSNGVPGLTLPLRIAGLNPRWSAGLLQRVGYTKGFYGPGENRWRSLGIETGGYAYVPLYVDRADTTSIAAGHPVVADRSGEDLFIQVTNAGGEPPRWHVSVNNPTDRPIHTVLHNTMRLSAISFVDLPVAIEPGAYLVVQ